MPPSKHTATERAIMISKKRKEELEKAADDAMAETIKNMPRMIKDKTNGAIAALFGF